MLKKVWMTDYNTYGLSSLTLESKGIEQHERIHVDSQQFPANKPNRHTVVIGLLEEEDINMLAQCLDRYRTDV